MAVEMRLEGLPEAIVRFDKLDKAFGYRGEKLRMVLVRAGKSMRDHIRAGTPVGTSGRKRKGVPIVPGTLRRKIGVIALRGTPKDQPGVRIHAFAPHAWLVENGHIAADGTHVGATHFFSRGVNSSVRVADMLITREHKKLIDRAARL